VVGTLDVAHGTIPFEAYQYDPEVTRKSGRHLLGEEALTYVRVNPNLPVPPGFDPPDGSEPVAYWAAAENRHKVVPYAYKTFDAIQKYDVYMSAFDLNGVYIGRSDLVEFDRERQTGRWDFHYQYLASLNRFEFYQWKVADKVYGELRLLSGEGGRDAIHFVFGNFSMEVGESLEFLFGVGTQPLVSRYNHDSYQDPMLYGLAYRTDGMILDHHDRGIGVEKIWIERLRSDAYRVRLISYERILPVWEGTIQGTFRPPPTTSLRKEGRVTGHPFIPRENPVETAVS
jgi:hypothetical protein